MLRQYAEEYAACVVQAASASDAERAAALIRAQKDRYETVERLVGTPWRFVGLVHQMESNQNFACHLHNGDPLTARTSSIPVGRPRLGKPPFTWEQSAVDAITLWGLSVAGISWDAPGMLYQLERWNGFGYRKYGVNTPYLWAGSNLYTSGKFVADGKFDPDAVSRQIGAAVLMKYLEGDAT